VIVTRRAVVDGRQLFWKTNPKLFLCGFMVACMCRPFGTRAVLLLTRHCRAGLSDSAPRAATNKSAISLSPAKSLERRRSEGQGKNDCGDPAIKRLLKILTAENAEDSPRAPSKGGSMRTCGMRAAKSQRRKWTRVKTNKKIMRSGPATRTAFCQREFHVYPLTPQRAAESAPCASFVLYAV
jgi:hypothetical protein